MKRCFHAVLTAAVLGAAAAHPVLAAPNAGAQTERAIADETTIDMSSAITGRTYRVQIVLGEAQRPCRSTAIC